MKIPPYFWYENKAGKRWIPPSLLSVKPPRGFIYQRSRRPMQLSESVCVVGGGEIMRSSRGVSEELVAALVGLKKRPGRPTISGAMLLVGVACERCLNVMAYNAGLRWGYRKGSKQYRACNTSCELCRTRNGTPKP